jgi:membrane protease YdiL (CAAX protease family)
MPSDTEALEPASRQSVRDALLARPVLLWALFLLAITAMGILAKWLTPALRPGPAGVGLVQVILQLGMLLLLVPFAARVGCDALGLRRLPAPRDGLVLLFPTLTVVIGYFAGFRHVDVPTLILAFASVVLAGVVEETAFRGILLTRLLPRGLWTAVLLSSALFGLLHVANLFLGSPWQTVLLQVTFAAMAGTGYAAMRLRTGSLWPPIVLHALFDLTFRVTALEAGTPFHSAIQMLHGVGWLIYAAIALRRTAFVEEHCDTCSVVQMRRPESQAVSPIIR